MAGFKTTAQRVSPARTHEKRTHAGDDASVRRRFSARFRVRLTISNCCLRSTDSATTERAPPGPTSRAIVVRELPRTSKRGFGPKAYRIGLVEGSPFRVPLGRHRCCFSCDRFSVIRYAAIEGDDGVRCWRSTVTPIAQTKPKSSRPIAVTACCRHLPRPSSVRYRA